VVVDGEKGEKDYDALFSSETSKRGKIIFDNSDSLHYIAADASNIYLIEHRIV
jgi:hypothetical protein